MEVMLRLDIHHEGQSIGNLGNVHVPLMQFIHCHWEVLDLVWHDQRLAPGIFSFYFLLSSRRHGLDIEELSYSDPDRLSLRNMLLGYYHIAHPGNVNGLPTIILGAPTLMCCWHNKLGGGGVIGPPVLPRKSGSLESLREEKIFSVFGALQEL